MALGTSLNQIAQIGLEVTPGTLVPATRRLAGIGIEANREGDIASFRPRGAKYKSGHIQNREWATAPISGLLTFNEIQYIFASVVHKPDPITQVVVGRTWTANMTLVVGEYVRPSTSNGFIYIVTASDGAAGATEPVWPTTPNATVSADGVTYRNAGSNASGAYNYNFRSRQWQKDDVQSYTIETPVDLQRNRGKRAGYALVNTFNFQFPREGEMSVGGEMLAQILDANPPTTAGVIVKNPVFASPKMVRVYMDASAANIGTTKVTDAFEGSFEIGNRFIPAWVLDSDVPSWKEHGESEPSVTTALAVADDTGLDDIILATRNGDRRYIRIEITGPQISPGANHKLTIDFVGGASEVAKYKDQNGFYAADLSFEAEYDDALGYAFNVNLITNEPSL